MARGVLSFKAWFPVIPITFGLAWLAMPADPVRGQQPESAPAAEAEKPMAQELSGFELLEAYAQKVARLETFQKDRLLRETDLQGRKSRTADEVNRLIGGFKRLMDQEAQTLFDEAMRTEDPKLRDDILKRLSDSKFQLQDIRRRAEYELKRRTVDGTVYPTLEEAQQKLQALEEERRKRLDGVDQKDLEDLEGLTKELLNDRVAEAAKAFAEEDAEMMVDTAKRLVAPQRKALLEEVLRKHPGTSGAESARSLLALVNFHNERLADHKLHKALASGVLYDQRWRRLKEIELHHPKTNAAAEANRLFAEHLAQVPPVTIANHTDQIAELMVDVPYSRLKNLRIEPGAAEIVSSAFPLVIRVNIGNNEWAFYNALPGMRYFVQTTHGAPVLYAAP